MTRISANHMYLAKWILPLATFLFVATYMVVKETAKQAPHFDTLYTALAVCAVIFGLTFKKRMWCLADEVLDGGEYLLIRFGKRQERVELSNIHRIELKSDFGTTTITLMLAMPCEFGTTVSFLAKSLSRNPFAPNAVAENLIARIGQDEQFQKQE